jgi:hypothetical protein
MTRHRLCRGWATFFGKEMLLYVAFSVIIFYNKLKSDMAFIKEIYMDQKMTDMAIEKLKADKDFQNALKKYEEAESLSQEKSAEMAKQLVEMLHLDDAKQTIEDSRFNLLVAKMTAAKLLATMASFSYVEKDFMESLMNARKCVQEELVPMLMQKEPCGECEACKNGHPDRCIRPKVREAYCESRFLPLLSDALIEYDAWSEILYNNIPHDKRDIDILKDIDDKFNNSVIAEQPKKRRGRPPKNKEE